MVILTIMAGAAFSPTHSSSRLPSGVAASSQRSKLSRAMRPCGYDRSGTNLGVARVKLDVESRSFGERESPCSIADALRSGGETEDL